MGTTWQPRVELGVTTRGSHARRRVLQLYRGTAKALILVLRFIAPSPAVQDKFQIHPEGWQVGKAGEHMCTAGECGCDIDLPQDHSSSHTPDLSTKPNFWCNRCLRSVCAVSEPRHIDNVNRRSRTPVSLKRLHLYVYAVFLAFSVIHASKSLVQRRCKFNHPVLFNRH